MKTIIRTVITVLALGSTMLTKAQAPLLSSHPSAPAVIFLDFDGHTVVGTSWNYNGPIVCDGSGLNTAQITEIFNRIAEDYRPFNLNITTDSTKFLAAPVNKRMRVILTVSSSWYGAAGGVAFINSFTWGDDNPCFVFSALLNNNVKFIAEAASHEAGHTLGMYHQAAYDTACNKLSDYYNGQGSGEIGWAPIMGVGYYRNLTLWNNGPNPFGCSNLQNDLDIITSPSNGFGYRTDDQPSNFSSAAITPFASNQFNVNGVVERNTDVDIFKFSVEANGRFQLDAIPYNVGTGNSGSDLDLQVTLHNSSETVLNVYNPGSLLSSVVDTVLNTGVYYIKVEGKGNLYAPAYASLGSYSLLGRITPGAVLPLHRLELRGFMNGDKHEFSWVIDADEQVTELNVEVSTDGRNFQQLTQSPNDARAYSYRPYNLTSAYYRLSVTFDNGRHYYSNVIQIRQQGNSPRPELMGNMITGGTIYVSSPGKFDYTIVDINGKLVVSGLIANGVNTINSPAISKGMYVIRFADNNQQWTDKFVSQ